jgi:2-phospho-L-lactate guanylyltransferase
MRTVVPFDPRNPNSRLAAVLDGTDGDDDDDGECDEREQRREFAYAMLEDVLAAVRAAGGEPELLASAPVGRDVGAPVSVDERSLSVAVQDALTGSDGDDSGLPAAVVMADLPLATPEAVGRLFDADADVALAPGTAGGTNALVVREPGFAVDYHGVSFRDHVAAAERAGLDVAAVDSFRLAVDVDDPRDLVDVLVHGDTDSRAAAWLSDAGYALAVRDGEPTVAVEPNA